MAIANGTVFETATTAFNAHDLDGLACSLAEDIVFGAPGGIAGADRAACIAFYRRWLEEFPDAHLEVEAVHVADDVAVERGVFTGTPDGVARTGRSVAVPYVQLLRRRDGKLVSMTLMFDRLMMLEQLGLAGDPPCRP